MRQIARRAVRDDCVVSYLNKAEYHTENYERQAKYQKYKRSENAFAEFDTVISDQVEKETSTVTTRQSSKEMNKGSQG